MDNIDTTSSTFHTTFDSNVREMMEPVRDTLIESVESCTSEEIIGQLLMSLLGDGYDFATANLSTDLKSRLVRIADHMGPDWAQALYRAAVFITKVT